MVSAFLADALRDPTGELKELYSSTSDSARDDFPKAVSAHFSRVFRSPDAFKEIRPLDIRNPPESHPDRSLVRFRAMIQDTSSSAEMYLVQYPNGTLGGWGIELDSPENDGSENAIEYEHLGECTVLWAVSVPGESTWSAFELDGSDDACTSVPASHRPPRPHKGPLPEKPHVGVKVKIYNTGASDTLRSTDIVTFVGILSSEPINAEFGEQIEVPALHVLFISPDEYTCVERPYPSTNPSSETTLIPVSEVLQVRDQLIDWIAEEALGGDQEAAEWVLLTSIARVQSWNPPLLPPSLTLSHFPSPPAHLVNSAEQLQSLPPAYHPTLTHVLSEVLPLTETLPLSLPYLNTVPFTPESIDEDLHAGALQLPKGSVLLITEGGVSEGKLQERGVMNVQALQDVISTQSLAYKFPFSQFSFPTDISCIILSEGRKSAFFKTDLTIPFKPKESSAASVANLYKPANSIKMPPQNRLDAFRNLIVSAQRGKVQVSDAISEFIQQDFVTERQRKAVTADDLIRRMTIAKLYALSSHLPELTIDLWERAKAFDERRLARFA